MSLTRVVSSSDEGHDVRSALTAGNPVGRAPGGHVSPAATSAASPSTKRRRPRRRVYVLDTSVLLADPSAITRFAEHDVVLPIVVVTELEAKRHHPELGWFARQALHLLDDLRIALRTLPRMPGFSSRHFRSLSPRSKPYASVW